ncbi:DEAD box family helicase [Coprinopsis sp. MPI-PUGE-AT-0042]|nr:DEAD box family helicase [Coprinopsis sp. MPI-PUGE-AT-0042]
MLLLHVRCSSRRSSHHLRFLSTAAAPIVFRPYQEHCLKACLEALQNGVSRIGVSLPTGSGKTTVFIELLSRLRAASKLGTRSLVIVNSIELARQSAATAQQLYPEWTVEIEQGAKYNASGLADLTVATYQTLLNPNRVEKFDPKYFKAVVVDEAHHAAAPSYRKLLSQFHCDIRPKVQTVDAEKQAQDLTPEHDHRVPIIGFSATFSRHDGLALGSVFEEIVYHRDFLEMMAEEWLCGVRLTTAQVELHLETVPVNAASGDFQKSGLSKVMNTPTMNDTLIKVWLDRAAPTRKSTLVFCVDLAHVRDVTNCFRSFGVDARFIHSGTPPAERKELITSFRAGEYPVLVNCAVLTEGADIPNIDCVVLARPTRSRNVFMQMIGRGMRLSPATGKTDCLLIDFADSSRRITDLMSLPTLLGIDAWEMDRSKDVTLEELKDKIREDSQVSAPEPVSVTLMDYDDLSVFDSRKKGQHYKALSPLAWVPTRKDTFTLGILGKGTVQVKRVEGAKPGGAEYVGEYSVRDRPGSRKILEAGDLESALRSADAYIQAKLIGRSEFSLLFRNAAWRRKSASDAQKKLIKGKLDHAKGKPASEERLKKLIYTSLEGRSGPISPDKLPIGEVVETLTKGEASNILSKLMHGSLAAIKSAEKLRAENQRVLSTLKQKRDSAAANRAYFLEALSHRIDGTRTAVAK